MHYATMPHVITQGERDFPKVNIFCAMFKWKVHELFFSLRTLLLVSIIWICWLSSCFHYWKTTRRAWGGQWIPLPARQGTPQSNWLPEKWIRHARANNVFCTWLLWPSNLFVTSWVTWKMFSLHLYGLRICNCCAAIESILADILQRVWEYHLNVCCMTQGTHIWVKYLKC